MKKSLFLFVLVFTTLITSSVSAYNFRNTADIQTFFNSVSGSPQDKLKDSITALNVHAQRLQNELNATLGERSGLLLPRISSRLANATLVVSSSTPIFEIELYATGTPMVVERVNLQVKVKSNGIEENPAVLINSLYVTGENKVYTIPVQSDTFSRDTTSIPGQTIYYIQLAGLGFNIPVANLSKYMTVYASMNKTFVDKEVTVGVYSTHGIRAVDSKNISSYYGLADLKTFIIKPASGGNRRGIPAPVINATSGPSITLPKTSFFGNFVKNVQAQVIYMFGK